MTAIVPLLFSFLCVLLCSHNVLSYDYCSGTDQCTGSRIWCCRVPDQYNLEKRKCCSRSCGSPDWNNFCVTEPSPPSSNPTSTVVVVVPTVIVILIITGIVIIVVRICCCARRPPPSVARPQQTVTVIRSGVTSPPMQHNPYQTGGVGIHPPPMTGGYNNSGFVPATYAQGNPGQTYPPVSTAYPPVSTAYPPAVSAGYQTQANLAPPPPYSQTDPNSKQPAFNPGNY